MPSDVLLQKFVTESLRHEDALVEVSEQGLECLLSSETAEALGVPEEWSLEREHADEERRLAYGTRWLEELIERQTTGGRWTSVELPDLGTRQSGVMGELKLRLGLQGGTHELGRTFVSRSSYLVLIFEYEATSGALRDGGQTWVALNEETKVEAPWFPFEELERYGAKQGSSTLLNQPISTLEPVFNRLCREEMQLVLEDFFQQRERQALRKRRQLERAHRRERKELLQPLMQGEALILEELGEAEEEYLLSLEELPDEFPVNLQLRPLALLRMSMPVTKVECTLRYKKNQRTLHWIWNPLLEGFEPLACEKTGESGFRFFVTPELKIQKDPPNQKEN